MQAFLGISGHEALRKSRTLSGPPFLISKMGIIRYRLEGY